MKTAASEPRATLARPEADLVALLAGRPAASSRLSEEDSRALLHHLLATWQVLPAMAAEPVDASLARVLAPDDYLRLRRVRLAVEAFSRARVAASRQLLHALDDQGLRYCTLKGTAASFVVYPDPAMRAGWDMDVGVRSEDLAQAEVIAHQVGYHSAQQDPRTGRFYRADARLKAVVETSHYELGFLVRRLQITNLPDDVLEAIRAEPWTHQFWFDVEDRWPCCYASVDIHHALSLDIPLEGLLATSRVVAAADHTVHVPDDAWMAAHLVFKLYWESVHNYRKGLYQYADLARIAPRLDAQTFSRLVEILTRYNLVAAAHYVFRRLPLFGVSLSKHVAAFVAQTETAPASGDPVHHNDLGDMWPKLWGRR